MWPTTFSKPTGAFGSRSLTWDTLTHSLLMCPNSLRSGAYQGLPIICLSNSSALSLSLLSEIHIIPSSHLNTPSS